MFGILGLPIPDETLLVFCGYLIYKGQLHGPTAFLAGFTGSLCGITLSYVIGLKFRRFTRYLRLTPQRIEQVEAWFHRIGLWSLTVGYFIPGVRHFTAIVAGTSRLPLGRFAAFAYPGAAIWVATFLTLGYVFGERWEHTSEVFHRYSLIATGVAVLVGAVFLLGRHYKRVKRISGRDQ